MLNAFVTCSIVAAYIGESEVLIASLIVSSIASIATPVMAVLDFKEKQHDNHTSYLQLYDLFNDGKNQLLKASVDLDGLLANLNAKLGLILDSADVVSISESQ